MAFRTVHCQSKKPLTDMLHNFIHPRVSIKQKPVSSQISGCTQFTKILRIEFIGSQHLADHLVIGCIIIERFHNPVTPMPNVLLTVAQFLPESPPVTVSPDIHPMSPPPLSVTGIVEQTIDQLFVPCHMHVTLQRLHVCLFRWDTYQVKI